jgi:hypothetical protein
MDRVQLLEMLDGARREPIRGEARQKGGGAAPSRDPTVLSCPIIEVLKEVSVNSAVAGGRDRRNVGKRQEPVSGKVAF